MPAIVPGAAIPGLAVPGAMTPGWPVSAVIVPPGGLFAFGSLMLAWETGDLGVNWAFGPVMLGETAGPPILTP